MSPGAFVCEGLFSGSAMMWDSRLKHALALFIKKLAAKLGKICNVNAKSADILKPTWVGFDLNIKKEDQARLLIYLDLHDGNSSSGGTEDNMAI